MFSDQLTRPTETKQDDVVPSPAGAPLQQLQLVKGVRAALETGDTVAVSRCVCVKFVPVAK